MAAAGQEVLGLKSRQDAFLNEESGENSATLGRRQPRQQFLQLSGLQQAGIFQPAQEPLPIDVQNSHESPATRSGDE